MSRFESDDWEPAPNPNQAQFYEQSVRLAMAGKRGRKLLAELREALEHLPQKRLIAGAFCQKPIEDEDGEPEESPAIVAGQMSVGLLPDIAPIAFPSGGYEVCVVGAFRWWKLVKAGKDPIEAFDELPELNEEESYAAFETTWEGQKAGLPFVLAWELASANDETWGDLTPEDRYERFMKWIDERLAAPEWHRGDPLPERIGHSWAFNG